MVVDVLSKDSSSLPAGVVTASIVLTATFLVCLFGFPYDKLIAQNAFSFIFYSSVGIGIFALIMTFGFLTRQIPKTFSDVIFAVRYLKQKGWLLQMHKSNKQPDNGILSKVFSINVVGTILLISVIFVLILGFVYPHEFTLLLNKIVRHVDENTITQVLKMFSQAIMIIPLVFLAIWLVSISPEIINDWYNWKKVGEAESFG